MIRSLARAFTLIELLIVVAIIAILAAIAIPNMLQAQTRGKVAAVKSDQRVLSIALEAYHIAYNRYPPAPNAFVAPDALAQTWRLTTPVAYITSYFRDPFADTRGATFHYSKSPTGYGATWLIWSYGPDTDQEEPNPGKYTDAGGDVGLVLIHEPMVETQYHSPYSTMPSKTLVENGTYDPSNGTASNGDIYLFN